jgi:hypothetical protein
VIFSWRVDLSPVAAHAGYLRVRLLGSSEASYGSHPAYHRQL